MKVHSKHWLAAALAFFMVSGVSSAALDSDGDGVPDDQDECPQTPPKTAVDKRGCPLKTDQDHDGVADAVDDCPSTVPGAVVDAHGCALDDDGDGVPDGVDQCPHTPKGVSVDPKGCPLNAATQTKPALSTKQRASRANTPPPPKMTTQAEPAPSAEAAQPAISHPAPETAAMPMPEPLKPVAVPKPVLPAEPKSEEPSVAAKPPVPAPAQQPAAKPTLRQALSKLTEPKAVAPAAQPKPSSKPVVAAATAPPRVEQPEAVPVKPESQPVELPRFVVINFAVGSAELSADSLRKLNVLGQGLPAKPSIKLQIQGHADSAKDGRWPDDLARQRADIVRVYLDGQGVAKNRVMLGSQVERASSAEEGRDNRRVDIQLIE